MDKKRRERCTQVCVSGEAAFRKRMGRMASPEQGGETKLARSLMRWGPGVCELAVAGLHSSPQPPRFRVLFCRAAHLLFSFATVSRATASHLIFFFIFPLLFRLSPQPLIVQLHQPENPSSHLTRFLLIYCICISPRSVTLHNPRRFGAWRGDAPGRIAPYCFAPSTTSLPSPYRPRHQQCDMLTRIFREFNTPKRQNAS